MTVYLEKILDYDHELSTPIVASLGLPSSGIPVKSPCVAAPYITPETIEQWDTTYLLSRQTPSLFGEIKRRRKRNGSSIVRLWCNRRINTQSTFGWSRNASDCMKMACLSWFIMATCARSVLPGLRCHHTSGFASTDIEEWDEGQKCDRTTRFHVIC
jgi:hypothetical protein